MMGGSGQLVLCVDSDQLTLDTLYFYLATADFTVNCFSAIRIDPGMIIKPNIIGMLPVDDLTERIEELF